MKEEKKRNETELYTFRLEQEEVHFAIICIELNALKGKRIRASHIHCVLKNVIY